MSDYYSPNDPTRNQNRHIDYTSGSSGSWWIWAGIFLVALIALVAALGSGGGETTGGEAAAPSAIAPADGTAPAAPAAPVTDDSAAPAATDN